MKDTLKGIEADLVRMREDRDRKKAALDEAQAKVDRLLAVKEFLRGNSPLTPPVASEDVSDEAKQAIADRPKRGRPRGSRNGSGTRKARGSDPTRIGDEQVGVDRLIELLPQTMQASGNGGMTEKQLDVAVALRGRGRFNTLRAALSALVKSGRFVVLNEEADDGSPLYVLSGHES